MKETLRRKLMVLILAVLLGFVSMPVVSVWAETIENSSNKIHFIALTGHSDAILLESNGRFGMVDSGEDSDYPDGSDSRYPLRSGIIKTAGFEEEVITYMKSVGVTKDNFEFYIGTHPHSDHIGSADEIIREFEPERVYIMEYRDEYISSEANLWDNLYVYDNMIEAAQDVEAVLIQNFDEDAPVTPDQSSNNPTEDGVVEESEETVSKDFDQAILSEPAIVDMDEDSRAYSFHSQAEIQDMYGVDPLNPDDPQAVESAPDDGSGFPVLQSDDPNSTLGNSNSETTGNPIFFLGDMQLSIANYSDDYKTTPKPDCNYFSLGVLVEVNGYRAFLGGDIGNYDGDEDRLAAYLGEVDVLKLGHHGLSSSNTVDYMNALNPDHIVSTGLFSALYDSEGRMAAIDQLAAAKGTRLYFTREYAMDDLGNSIVFGLDGESIKTNVASDAIMFYECNSKPYVFCYQDGYKYHYTGFVTSNGTKYYFGQSAQPLTNQWVLSEGKWYYVKGDGTLQTGWMGEYYFNAEGVWIKNTVPEGWVKNSVGWWYRYPDGTYPASQWNYIKGAYYYFDDRGYMKTGWLKMEEGWYYLSNSGAMATGWQLVGGKWYYLNSSGVMQTGWIKVGGKHYYLDGNGAMKTGWQYLNDQWYYFSSNGDMQTGWQKIGTKWYYMNESGVMLTGWQTIKEKKYYLLESGAMAYGWQLIGGEWYYFGDNSDGSMKIGWQKIKNVWYYMDEDGVMLADCWIDDCYVNANGAWIQGKVKP